MYFKHYVNKIEDVFVEIAANSNNLNNYSNLQVNPR